MAFTKVVGAGIHTLSNIHSHNINSSGIITATNFVGPLDGTTGDFSGNVTIGGNLTVNGTTTTLDTNLIDVDKIEVTTDGNNVAVAITHNGDGDLVRLYDGSTQVVTVDDEGNVTSTGDLTISSSLPRITLNDTNHESDFDIKNENGSFRIRDLDNPTDRYRINSSGTIHEFFGTADFASHLTVDGNLYIADSIIHSSDTNTKIRFPADDTVTVETAGTERLRILSDGKVGIGTNNPATELEVHGDSGGTIRLAKGGANRTSVLAGDTLGKIQFRSYDSSLNYNSFNGTYAEIETVVTNDLGGLPSEEVRLDFKIADSDEPASGKAITPVPALSILQGGNVGIGNTIPSEKLDVTGNILTRSSTNTAQFQHNAVKFQTSGGAHIDHETTNQNLNFRVTKSSTSDTTMVQINAASEQTKFRKIITVGLQGGGDTTQIGGGAGIGAYLQLNYANNNIVNTKLMGNNTSWLNSHYGNLGIGTQTADEKFQVRTGTHKFISFTDAEHGSLSDLGSAIIFSRPSNGAKKICGIFQHTNQSLAIAARDDLTFHTGGNAFYYSGSERLRIKSDGDIEFGIRGSSSAITSGNIKHISLGKDYWNGDKGHYGALRLLVYDNGVNDAYGFGVSNGELEIQAQGNIGIYAGSAAGNSKRDRRMHIDSSGDVIFGYNNSGSVNSSALFNMSLGGTYHNTAGSMPKLSLWHDGTDHMGFGISSNQLEYILTSTDYDHVFYGGNAGTTELLRLDGGNNRLSFAGDTDTYIHHPEDNELAITVSGGSTPIARFGTGGNNATVGINTTVNLVTNSEILTVRGYSSFKSVNNLYAALYTHNESQGGGNICAHILLNVNGANRGGFGYDTDNSTLIMGNHNAISFRTGATNLNGTERLRIKNTGEVGINDSNPNAAFSVKLNGLPGTLADNSYQLRYSSRSGNNASGYTASGLGIYGTADNSNGDKHTTYIYFGSRDPALNGSHGAGAWITMSNPDSQGSYGTGQFDFYCRNSAAYTFPNDPAAISGYWMKSLFTIKSSRAVGINSSNPENHLLELFTDASADWKFRIHTNVSDGAGFYQRSNGDFELVLRDASNNNNYIAGTGGDLQFVSSGAEKLRIDSSNNIRSYATIVDTSYHANPDPFADGSGLVYYRMNYNFQDSGLYGFHGTGSQGSPNKEFNASPHFSLVNSSGEPCWDNPNEGAINIPNLKNTYPFSMAAWINVSSWPTTSDNDLIMNLSIGNQRISLSICCFHTAVSDGADFYIMYGGKGHHYFRPSSKPTNEWIHVVYSVVGDDNTDHRVYQNGSDLTTRGDRGGGHGGSAGWALGGNAANSERFSIGRIGSIRFFNKALSASEASALYTNDTFYT